MIKIPALLWIKKTYQNYPRQFWIVGFGVFLSSAGSSMIWPFQLIYISKTITTPITSVAALITISSLTGLIASVFGGAIADRFGRKVIMYSSQLSHGLAYLLMSTARTYAGFVIPMTIMGAAMPFYSIGSDSMMADIIPSEKRSEAYALLRVINNTGIAIGPAIGGLIISNSYSTAFYIASASMILYSMILLFFVKETLNKEAVSPARKDTQSFGGYNQVLKDRNFIIFAATITVGMIAPLMMWILLAVYMNKYYGIPEYMYSWLPITNALMCVVVQYPVTFFTRRMNPKSAITLGMLMYALGVGSVALMSNFWGFWLSMVIMTFGELILVPTGSKYVADIAPETLRGRYMSIYWLTWGLSRAAAPIIGGTLHDSIAPQAIWWGGLFLGLLSSSALFFLSRRPENHPLQISQG